MRNAGHEEGGIEGRPGCHGEDIARVRVDEDGCATAEGFCHDLFADFLEIKLEGGHDVHPRRGRVDDGFLSDTAFVVEEDVQLAGFAGELIFVRELECVPALDVGKKKLVVIDRSVGEPAGEADVAEDVAGEVAIGIGASVKGLGGESVVRESFDFGSVVLREVEGDDPRHDGTVSVVFCAGFNGERDGSTEFL